ncbi:restriction endonuclease subunit S [Chryseobacterium culicis]|uniref:restriction endonuclease subunit S n=1 Tax=Chryseobacterium culicis TaxID=680127 RepID=UPI0028972186|nr:restriction endonuclease subunit S [Chryseobacterium culicis]
METAEKYSWLNFVPFSSFDLWDTKRYTSKKIVSKYPIEKLGNCISEESTKYKLFDEPETEFGILGVNNKEGIFDAYLEKGKEINQAYKKMEVEWLAYNPYRINVGSIGIRKSKHKFEYISPAYVVFSCKENLLPEYLFLLFKTKTFNKVINESTTGSVRQNLTFEILESLEIPLPSLSEQQKIVDAYYKKISEAKELQQKAETLETDIERYLFEELGIIKNELNNRNFGLKIIEYRYLDRWDGVAKLAFNSKYPIAKASELIIKISTGTTPPTNVREYFEGNIDFYAPSDLGKEMYLYNAERKISEKAIADKKARVFEQNTLLFVGIGSTVGKVGIVKNDFATSNQQITGLNFNDKVIIEYLFYYFNYFIEETTKEKTQATIPIVNQDKILNISIPLPPLEKQKEIATHISKIKKEIERLRNEAGSLKERAEREFEETVFKTQ